MASCITPTFGSSTCPQVELTVVIKSQTSTTVTLAWELDYRAHGYAAYTGGNKKAYTAVIDGTTVASGSYDINGKTGSYKIAEGTITRNKSTSARNVPFSCSMAFNITWSGTYGGTKSASSSISIPAKTYYTITYNANSTDVTNMPGKQTKEAGTAIKLSGLWPLKPGHNFKGWATSASGSPVYQPGANYTTDANLNLYAIWQPVEYTVSYNANGGSGAPASQTKKWGINIKLSTTKPTRADYNFLGWGTSASSTTVAYAPGATYSTNAVITLYAIWERAYHNPRITNLSVDRCNSAGTLSEEGTYSLVKFNWACDRTVSSLKIEYKLSTSSTWTAVTVTGSGTSGSVSKVVGGSLSTESEYNVRVTVADSGGNSTLNANLAPMAFDIDVISGGGGVAIGKPATQKGIFDVAMISRFMKGAYVHTADASGGTAGYLKIAQIKILSAYVNTPIKMTLVQRGRQTVCDLYILFTNDADADPDLYRLRFDGDSRYKVYLNKSATSTWDLYVLKSEAWDSVHVLEYTTRPDFLKGTVNINVTWTNELVASVPSGATVASNNENVTWYESTGIDPNTTLYPLILTNHANRPSSVSAYWYISTFFYNFKTTSANRAQFAMPYSGKASMYHRLYYDGAWTAWRRLVNADETRCHVVETTVAINRSFSSYESTSAYAGSAPSKSGYTAVRLSGYTNGNVLMCAPNGWIMNVRNLTVPGITSVTWKWLMVPTE